MAHLCFKAVALMLFGLCMVFSYLIVWKLRLVYVSFVLSSNVITSQGQKKLCWPPACVSMPGVSWRQSRPATFDCCTP